MNERLKAYIDNLFAGAPRTRRVDDLREELLAGCQDKYDDLLARGIPEEEAFRTVVGGIGNIDELLSDLTSAERFDPVAIERARTRRTLYISLAVMMYIVSFAVMVLSDIFFSQSEIGFVIMLLIAAPTTGLLIYGLGVTKVSYTRQDDTAVEEIKERISGSDEQSRLRGAMSSSLWALIVIVYLGLSFLTGWWHVSWILFLVGGLLQTIISYYMSPKETRKKSLGGILWTGITVLYFILSFATGAWHITWLLFLLAVAIQQILRLWAIWREQV